jgi:hypothetical protein
MVHFWCIKIVRFVVDQPASVAGKTREPSGGNAVAIRLLRVTCLQTLSFPRTSAMTSIQACELPDNALLRRYLSGGAYADCYVTEVARVISHAEYVEAFYTTAVFKLERLLLSWFVARPSTDVQAGELASGKRTSFAAWSVEARAPDQLLLSDFQGRTRSWLMSAPASNNQITRLFFGSAVVPIVNRRTGEARMGFAFRALLGFHKLYSRVLLRAAAARLARSRPTEQ